MTFPRWFSRRSAVLLARRAYARGFADGLAHGRLESVRQMIVDAVFDRLGIRRKPAPATSKTEAPSLPEKPN